MKYLLFLGKCLAFLGVVICAHAETLHYAINWQSGLSLGEATLTSARTMWVIGKTETPHWNFDLDIDASLPGYPIRDHYASEAGPEICSADLVKTVHRGSHKSEERVTFDQAQHSATRDTLPTGPGGGTSDFAVSACAHDGLAFLQFMRQELAQGRLASQQPVILGGAYNVRLEFAGTESVKQLGKPVDTDKIHATIKGPASNFSVDIFFAKDEARTPVLARIPLPLGVFSVELTH